MGLKEGEGSELVEVIEEIGDVLPEPQGTKESKVGGVCILQTSQPKSFMLLVKVFQPIDESWI